MLVAVLVLAGLAISALCAFLVWNALPSSFEDEKGNPIRYAGD